MMLSNPFSSQRSLPKKPPLHASAPLELQPQQQSVLPSQQQQKEQQQIFNLKEVAKHTSAEDLWMIIHDKVYNVTKFIADHPGGAEVLFDCAGIDATASFDDVGHSDDAIEMLEECRLGVLSKKDQIFLNNINNLNATHERENRRIYKQQPTTAAAAPLVSSSSSSSASPIPVASPPASSPAMTPVALNNNNNIRKKKKPKDKLKQHRPHASALPPATTLSSSSSAAAAAAASSLNRYRFEQIMAKLSVPVLLCISVSAFILYLYLQSVKWDY